MNSKLNNLNIAKKIVITTSNICCELIHDFLESIYKEKHFRNFLYFSECMFH